MKRRVNVHGIPQDIRNETAAMIDNPGVPEDGCSAGRPEGIVSTDRGRMAPSSTNVNARERSQPGDDADGKSDDAPAPAKSLRILLAEDAAANRKVLKAYLCKCGHQVEIAKDGLEAVQCVTDGQFDVVIMDVEMPKLDGFEATRKIRMLQDKNAARVPIVAMTAHAGDEDRDRCLEVGMTAYLPKPVEVERLLTTLAHVVAS